MDMDVQMKQIRCGTYITPKKRPKFGYDKFIETSRSHGVIIVDLDLEGDVSKLPTNLDAILHKARSNCVLVVEIVFKIVTFDCVYTIISDNR
jgi:hypothetical protein